MWCEGSEKWDVSWGKCNLAALSFFVSFRFRISPKLALQLIRRCSPNPPLNPCSPKCKRRPASGLFPYVCVCVWVFVQGPLDAHSRLNIYIYIKICTKHFYINKKGFKFSASSSMSGLCLFLFYFILFFLVAWCSFCWFLCLSWVSFFFFWYLFFFFWQFSL